MRRARSSVVEPYPWMAGCFEVSGTGDMESLSAFREGLFTVQDAAARLVATVAAPQETDRVLDVCAAPGGKSAHLLELAEGQLDLTALDIDPQRLDRVRDNLQRMSLAATLLVGDATAPGGDWAQGEYHRILLDVPCSATGVIRRHPDIKWLRRPGDIEALCARQARMLDAIWPLLAPGGTLVYVTCSLLPDENEQQIRAFLSRHGDASEVPIEAEWGLARTSGRQTLPRVGGGDGFYFARLRKASS